MTILLDLIFWLLMRHFIFDNKGNASKTTKRVYKKAPTVVNIKTYLWWSGLIASPEH